MRGKGIVPPLKEEKKEGSEKDKGKMRERGYTPLCKEAKPEEEDEEEDGQEEEEEENTDLNTPN